MRRLGFLLALTLLTVGMNTPTYAAVRAHQLPHFAGPVLTDYGPHRREAVAQSRASTAVAGITVSDATASTCTSVSDTGAPLPTKLCVWYAPSGADAPADAAYVHEVLATLQHVETVYLRSGYRAVEPSADPQPGYADQFNLYLHDLGSTGLYGFTAPDSGRGLVSSAGHDRAAYVVIDNDFSATQYPDAHGFPGCTADCALDLMRVTLAHEFFHATQFAYDALTADRWFMEATATWAETQVYPALRDNWLYFSVPDGVLTKPAAPLDDNSGAASTLAFYQNFAWIQYLGRAFPTAYGSMPAIILNSWRYSDARSGFPAYFSVTAINRAISRQGGSLPAKWLAFSAGNRHHILGAGYPASRAVWSRTVSPTNLSQARVSGAVNHLSSQTFVLTPQRLRTTERLHLAIRVSHQTGTVAGLTLYYRNGAIRTYPLTFSGGAAARNVGFDSVTMLRAELTIGNASSRYSSCWTEWTDFACDGGTPAVGKVGFTWTGSFYHV